MTILEPAIELGRPGGQGENRIFDVDSDIEGRVLAGRTVRELRTHRRLVLMGEVAEYVVVRCGLKRASEVSCRGQCFKVVTCSG